MIVLGGLEGAMLIARLNSDVSRFSAAADRLLVSLEASFQTATHPPVATEKAG